MINWCNSNQGFLMVLLTLVYVIATIAICFFNYKTINEQKKIAATQKQISMFSVRNETYKIILSELHFWRFTNNEQVENFCNLSNKPDVLLHLATQCQDFCCNLRKFSF